MQTTENSSLEPLQSSATVTEPTIANTDKKKKKVRKPQTEEEYEIQKHIFQSQGPTINTDEWLYQLPDNLDNTKKPDRVMVLNACEKAYYDRDYDKCLELVKKAEIFFEVDYDKIIPLQQLNKKTQKSAKIERHILDLIHIKQKCLEKI